MKEEVPGLRRQRFLARWKGGMFLSPVFLSAQLYESWGERVLLPRGSPPAARLPRPRRRAGNLKEEFSPAGGGDSGTVGKRRARRVVLAQGRCPTAVMGAVVLNTDVAPGTYLPTYVDGNPPSSPLLPVRCSPARNLKEQFPPPDDDGSWTVGKRRARRVFDSSFIF